MNYALFRIHHVWRYNRYRLFLGIVWRAWDTLPDGSIYRLSWSTAWEVANIVHPV